MITKTALITGAAHRIGASISRRLHDDGYNVIIHYRQSAEAAQQLVDQLNKDRPDSAVCLSADLSDVSSVQQLAEQALGYWGRIDCLINNASSFYPSVIGEVTEQDWEDLFGGNAKGAFFLSQALTPSLKQHQGCIINLVDIHAQRPLPNYPVYSMAKSAVAMMTLSLAQSLAPDIRVNGVSPGAILWPEHEVTNEAKQAILNKVPMNKIGEPEDIAKTVAFLVDDAPYITGQIISVDGGRTLSI
jgi:pteridine reductase